MLMIMQKKIMAPKKHLNHIIEDTYDDKRMQFVCNKLQFQNAIITGFDDRNAAIVTFKNISLFSKASKTNKERLFPFIFLRFIYFRK